MSAAGKNWHVVLGMPSIVSPSLSFLLYRLSFVLFVLGMTDKKREKKRQNVFRVFFFSFFSALCVVELHEEETVGFFV